MNNSFDMDDLVIETPELIDIESIKKLEAEGDLCSWSEEDYLQEIAANNEFFLAAKKSQEILGFILARPIIIEQLPAVRYEAEIYNIAVSREHRRGKIASRLIDRLIEKANKYRVEKLYLEVRESNLTARKFYADNLFKIVGKRKNFYTNPCENAILMCRELSEEKNM
jgi:ribosomal-protein-alanine acetyltransferase